jgi:tRNA(adenine34) deaminase
MASDEQFLSLALAEARLCTQDVPIGCIIVKEGEIIARARNQREQAQDPVGHAEIVALKQAAAVLGRWRLHDCTIYCTLEPCPMCAEAILQSRIARVVFGAFDPSYGAITSAFNLYVKGRPFPLPEVTGGVLQPECESLLKDFFRRRRAENEEDKS